MEKGFVKSKEGRLNKEEMEALVRQDTSVARAKVALVEKASEAYADKFTEGPGEEEEEDAEEAEEEAEEAEDEEEVKVISAEKLEKLVEKQKVSEEPKQLIIEEQAKAIFAEGQKAGYKQAKRELLDWVIG